MPNTHPLIFLTMAISLLSPMVAFSQPTTSPTSKPASVRLDQVDALLNQAIQRGDIPGAVLLVLSKNQTVYHKAYGNRALQPQPEPMKLDTVFDIASLSKPVGCATSVMILAERGKLQLADKVAKYIPAFAQNGKQDITIEQLLLHTSGLIPDNPMADYRDGPATAMERIYALKPAKQPGQHFWYSDVNFIVLGELVRTVDGRSLDQFAQQEVFTPLGMTDTCYSPSAALAARCAPTEKRGDQWMIGQVHDPRAYALGGVAGHAGVFSTATDLGRFCQMILSAGQLDGKRLLKSDTIQQMTQPRPLPNLEGWRAYGLDVDTGYSSARGNRFPIGSTFGHTGFTGTSLWMDPANNCAVILLTNSVHPSGKGKTIQLRRQVATVVAESLLGPRSPSGPSMQTALGDQTPTASGPPANILCGIDVLKKDNFALLSGRRIALVTNHSGRDRDGNRTIDLLLSAKNLTLVKLLSPEHGLYGALDESIGDTIDPKTGLKVYSLYGKTRRPTDAMLQDVDTLVYDIQDVGARFYTYIATLGYCMEAAAKYKLRMVVLDRPNPIAGLIVDGPLADKDDLSFISYGPLPVAHGMTVGELAGFYNTQYAINCELDVVPMQGWNRNMWFDQTGLMWANPSPNMRNLNQATLYTGICLLESCNVSVGRGTDQPFETFGAPWIDARKLSAVLNASRLPGLRFIPVEFTPTSSKFANQPCQGVNILVTDRTAVQPVRAGLVIVWHLRRLFGDTFQYDKVGTLLRNKATLEALKSCQDPNAIHTLWAPAVDQFREARERHLLYK